MCDMASSRRRRWSVESMAAAVTMRTVLRIMVLDSTTGGWHIGRSALVRRRTSVLTEGRQRMTSLVVRRLLIDLETPFARHWNGGDAFRSAYFNALSMSFPVGEQFFIDSVRNGVKLLPEDQRAPFEAD